MWWKQNQSECRSGRLVPGSLIAPDDVGQSTSRPTSPSIGYAEVISLYPSLAFPPLRTIVKYQKNL